MVEVEQFGNVQVLRVTGEITFADANQPRALDLSGERIESISDVLARLLAADQSRIVVNLARVRFIDSSGFGELVRLKKTTQSQGGDLKLCDLPTPIQRAFEMTRLSDIFEIFPREKEAIAAFGS